MYFRSVTGWDVPELARALGLAYCKTKKADIDARQASLEQARHQALRSRVNFFLAKFGLSAL
jgi:hypothetical protein